VLSKFFAREMVAFARLLETLISIKICSKGPGQHLLAKQCPEGVSGDPFVYSADLSKYSNNFTKTKNTGKRKSF
jgi:hypothetical protein